MREWLQVQAARVPQGGALLPDPDLSLALLLRRRGGPHPGTAGVNSCPCLAAASQPARTCGANLCCLSRSPASAPNSGRQWIANPRLAAGLQREGAAPQGGERRDRHLAEGLPDHHQGGTLGRHPGEG